MHIKPALTQTTFTPTTMTGNNHKYAVTLKDLSKRFGDFIAVNRVTLDVKKGEIFGFLGPNGAGKSTTIRMLCGILPLTSGSGKVAGFDIVHEAEEIKKNIGYMSQRFSLYDDLTVEENINFYSGIYRIPAEKKIARKEWVLEMAGLIKHRHSMTSILSGGWKQRLALGCAILHEPPIIFLDEPTSGVDPISRRNFWDLINHLADQGVTVFVTTHYMDEAEYCDRLGLIYQGKMIAVGTPAELKGSFMHNDVIKISCQRPQDAMEYIEALPGVRHAALFGRGLHVVAETAKEVIPAIATRMAEMGFSDTRLELIRPSLEDVFVSLIEEQDSGTGYQQEFNR